eukprot:TRINITY_DN111388_c0_g1_i1.p1 TRINITY_DN111388_c0_g1~~TRINITY_DN111388_c0_g1_i1.p1  ORF type:complete len:600 (-),score=116.00 TRINITY_DN111388_c0_g1_i1:94-1893(-)
MDPDSPDDLAPDLKAILTWLESIGFGRYKAEVSAWCVEEGAALVEELQECWEEVAERLALEGDDLSRFQLACSSDQPQVQFHIGDYGVLEKLGSGATATVYKCVEDGMYYAAKAIDLQRLRKRAADEDVMLKLNNETRLLRSLRHEKIVHLHDVVVTDKEYCLVMEFVEGGDLDDHILAQPTQCLYDDEARHVFVQLTDALEYIHSKNVIHRDLKPENILVDALASTPGFPEVKVTDFGHSKLIRDGYTQGHGCVGTRAYWAPEVAKAETYDETADLWSLGVVLYVMLSGVVPFDESAPQSEKFDFQGTKQQEEIVRSLVRLAPKDRLLLAKLWGCVWLQNVARPSIGRLESTPVQAAAREHFSVRIPRKPDNRKRFITQLDAFGQKYRAAAKLQMLTVEVLCRPGTDASRIRRAREDLMVILVENFPDMQDEHADKAASAGAAGSTAAAAARSAELSELQETYGRQLEVVSDFEWRVWFGPDDAVRVLLPVGYPESEGPSPVVECASALKPWFREEDLATTTWVPGQPCVYDIVEQVREALPSPRRGGGDVSSTPQRKISERLEKKCSTSSVQTSSGGSSDPPTSDTKAGSHKSKPRK